MAKNKKYTVRVSYKVYDYYTIEAENEQEAIEQALEVSSEDSLNDYTQDGDGEAIVTMIDNKPVEPEKKCNDKVRVLCFCDTEDDYKGVLLVTGIDANLKAKRKDIEDAIRPAFFDEYMADAGEDEDEDLFQQVLDKLAAGQDADFHEYEIFWDNTVMV